MPYGYIADPNDRNHLLPDPETANVVKQIFAMYVRGDRMCEIQNWLREHEILTVSELRYRRTGSCRHPRPHPTCIYNWPDKTLYDILTRKEYLGHTITGKSYKVSYKSKKTKKNPEEKQYFFPNTHEALIDEETFDLAQKRIATRHRPTKVETIDIFRDFSFVGSADIKCISNRAPEHWNANTLILAENTETVSEQAKSAQHIISEKAYFKNLSLPTCKGYYLM